MDDSKKNRRDGKKRSKKAAMIIAVLLLLLILIILIGVIIGYLDKLRALRSQLGFRRGATYDTTAITADSILAGAGMHAADTLAAVVDSAGLDTSAMPADRRHKDSIEALRRRQAKRLKAAVDSSSLHAVADSADSLQAATPVPPCMLDTVPPWIFPDPSGGLHRRHVAVRLLSVERCTIQWRFAGEKAWHAYTDEPILITRDTTLKFTATDTCGNKLPVRTENYTIARPLAFKRCPDDMEYVKVGASEFCIDRYEWPNKRGHKPLSYVSIYQARDSCYIAKKRLCDTDEWMIACGGAYGWHYPYGGMYEPYACNTQDTAVFASGSKVECRGYFDIYDMTGNLAEWTNTPSARNRKFYNVMGGFWDSGPQGSCFEKRYSYFPQNRHNPVGFRCCADAAPQDSVSIKKK
jgi:hypothetical protein